MFQCQNLSFFPLVFAAAAVVIFAHLLIVFGGGIEGVVVGEVKHVCTHTRKNMHVCRHTYVACVFAPPSLQRGGGEEEPSQQWILDKFPTELPERKEHADFVNKCQLCVCFDAKVDTKVSITKDNINNNCQ